MHKMPVSAVQQALKAHLNCYQTFVEEVGGRLQ